MKKIYYCLSQIKITHNLLDLIDSDFFARVLSRQIIIRIYDFITITRQYNNAFITDLTLKREIKNKLNLLSNDFEDNLKLQRHKLSAHFQDLEFEERIDSWSSITKKQIDTFYDKILEIYILLRNENDFQEITNVDFELSSNEIQKIQNLVNNKNIEKEPYFSNDILSITRANTSAIIPCHPIQDKVLSINSIHLMIDFEIALYNVLASSNYKKLISIILTNDIISFIDNLITRDYSQYIGLDKIIDKQLHHWLYLKYQINKPINFQLLKQSKYDYKLDIELKNAQNILNSFLDIYNVDILNEIRMFRNKLGSHIDTRDNIDDLLGLIDNLDINFLLKTYSDFYNIFYKICDSVFYLKHFTMPPTKINGIISISPQPNKMFFEDKYIQTEFEKENINDEKLYELKIKKILTNDNNFEATESYFREALFHSDVIESITFEDNNIDLNKCHIYFLYKLSSNIDINEKRTILMLLKKSSGLCEKQAVYILNTTYEKNKIKLNYEYIVSLGYVTQYDSKIVFDILLKNLKETNDFNTVYYVILSYLKIDANIRGTILVNNRKQAAENKYSKIIKSTIQKFNPFFKVIISTLVKSEMIFTNSFSFYRDYYKELYLDYFQQIFFKNIKLLKPNNFLKKRLEKKDINDLKIAYKNNILTIVFIKIAEKCNRANANFLYSIIVNFLKLNFQNLQFIEHYAYANYKIGNINKAVEIYQDLVYKNPNELDYRIQLLSYFIEQKNMISIKNELLYIEKVFKLNKKQQETVANIKQLIEDQQNLALNR